MTITEAPAPELYCRTEVYCSASRTWDDCGDYGPGAAVPASRTAAYSELEGAWDSYIEDWARTDGGACYRLTWRTLDDELVASVELDVIRDEDDVIIGYVPAAFLTY